eukprot:gnl/Hemi2/9129_TR3170_c0_g1_i1.p1 gnl/Hemi2/9129_TR3170_c0_g1~~gnl/Hemi2/9129_TR3170_c0_g1_i1.p1  ORF type:complete len:114 (+),score=36.73 gnl/Hemi2/9129_TR3170_c0_g1_i1:56-397(+)
MDNLHGGDEASFQEEDTKQIIKDACDSVLKDQLYTHTKVQQLTSNVVEAVLRRMTQLNKPFKYVVTCMILQRNGAGLHTASSCYWDNAVDGAATFKWENKSMYCIVTVYGLAI